MGLKLGVEKTEGRKGHDHNRSNIAPQETTKKKIRDATRVRGNLGYSSCCCVNPPTGDDVAAAISNKSKKLKAGDRHHSFSYDPKSYAHNFDEGNIDHDDDVQYSSRFADFSSMKEKK